MAAVYRYFNRRAVACLIGGRNGLFVGCRCNGQLAVCQSNDIAVQCHGNTIIVCKCQCNGAAVGLTVVRTVYNRSGRVQYNSVRAQIINIARCIGNSYIYNELFVRL